MNYEEEPPLKIELASLAADPRYQVSSQLEILQILRAMMQRGELVAAYFGNGSDFVLTTILAVAPESKTLILDYGANAYLNKRLLASDHIICVGVYEKIRVQFKAGHVEEVQFNHQPAFQLRIPDIMLKLQRRDYYRLTTPLATPVLCSIATPDGVRVTLNVLDISIGGISILGYPPEIELKLGVLYHGCSIILPEHGTIVTNLEIRNSFDVTLKNNVKTRRSGCMFLDMPASAQTMIQKYMIKLERERRHRLEGD